MISIMRDDRPMTQILVADFLRSRFCSHFPIGRAVIVLRDLFPTHPGRSVRLLARHFVCCFLGVLFTCDSELN